MASGLYGGMISLFGTVLGCFGSLPFCCCFPSPYKTVYQGNVGLFTSFGRYRRTVNAGLTYYNIMTEQLVIVDVRMCNVDIPRQTTVTKDNVSVGIDSVLFYQIVSPYKATFEVVNIRAALVDRVTTTLREVFGFHDLQDAIVNRETVAHEIQKRIAPIAAQWGVRIESVLVKDILFSKELQDSLASASVAKRMGASKVIAAEAEVQSAMLMRKTAQILSNPAAMQIRYLETLKV